MILLLWIRALDHKVKKEVWNYTVKNCVCIPDIFADGTNWYEANVVPHKYANGHKTLSLDQGWYVEAYLRYEVKVVSILFCRKDEPKGIGIITDAPTA